MKINYKILSVDHKEHSMVVRYYTDVLTEEMLAVDANRNEDGTPVRCRTDYNINIWKYPATEEAIEKQIMEAAPIEFFKVKEYAHSQPASLGHIEHHVGKSKSFVYTPPIPVTQAPAQSRELTTEEIEALLKSLS